MWITMWKLDFPMHRAVDNFVENSESYPHKNFAIVDK